MNSIDVRERLEAAREKFLWEVYFNQAATEGEKEALLRREQEKHRIITVVDPDSFAGTEDW